MIDIIITSYNEPKATLRAVNTFLKQKINEKYKIIVCDPFIKVKKFIQKNVNNKKVSFYLDYGEGKSYALNLLLKKLYSNNRDNILIFTDGDVYVSENALDEIINAFKDKNLGCITCKIVSIDNKNTKYGYWSHLLFSGANKLRKKLSNNKFFECSGYLFAIRNGIIKEFSMDVSEDSIIPYLFWNKNYKIKYLDKAEVYVKNPDNWKDWKNQKIRNIKGHENLNKIYPKMPRTKSFFNEIKYGLLHVISSPKTIKEMFWTIELLFARLFIYAKAFYELRKKKVYSDGWRETEIKSAKPLD